MMHTLMYFWLLFVAITTVVDAIKMAMNGSCKWLLWVLIFPLPPILYFLITEWPL